MSGDNDKRLITHTEEVEKTKLEKVESKETKETKTKKQVEENVTSSKH